MDEIWKPVPSEPGVFASSLGRVLLPPRFGALPNGGYRLYEPKPTIGVVNRSYKGAKHKYYQVLLKSDRPGQRQRTRKVHQLVCEAFHGPRPFARAVVLHLDENGLNNRQENLRWGTQKENLNMPKFKAWQRSPERNARIALAKQIKREAA